MAHEFPYIAAIAVTSAVGIAASAANAARPWPAQVRAPHIAAAPAVPRVTGPTVPPGHLVLSLGPTGAPAVRRAAAAYPEPWWLHGPAQSCSQPSVSRGFGAARPNFGYSNGFGEPHD